MDQYEFAYISFVLAQTKIQWLKNSAEKITSRASQSWPGFVGPVKRRGFVRPVTRSIEGVKSTHVQFGGDTGGDNPRISSLTV